MGFWCDNGICNNCCFWYKLRVSCMNWDKPKSFQRSRTFAPLSTMMARWNEASQTPSVPCCHTPCTQILLLEGWYFRILKTRSLKIGFMIGLHLAFLYPPVTKCGLLENLPAKVKVDFPSERHLHYFDYFPATFDDTISVPSGKLTVCCWKLPFIVDLSIKKVIFHGYVSLPEGTLSSSHDVFLGQSHSLQVLARLAPNFKKSWVPLGGMAVASGNLGALRTWTSLYSILGYIMFHGYIGFTILLIGNSSIFMGYCLLP